MGFKSLSAIIDFAISKEIEAAAFYTRVSEQESFSGKREMFLEFAREERKHQTMLRNLKAGGVQGKLDQYRYQWIRDIKRSNYVADLAYKPGMPYSDILLLAAKREEKALALYNDMLAHAESNEARRVFKLLCQEEARHKLALETMLDDYMAEMGD